MAALFDRLARLPIWKKVERYISSLSPWSVLFVFGIPVLTLLPVKFLALYLFGEGHFVVGTLLLMASKLFGTAICARIFQLTRPALMKFGWFSYWYPRWKKWKDQLLMRVRRSRFWHLMQKMKSTIKNWWVKIHPLVTK